jgi:hypothetical protein
MSYYPAKKKPYTMTRARIPARYKPVGVPRQIGYRTPAVNYKRNTMTITRPLYSTTRQNTGSQRSGEIKAYDFLLDSTAQQLSSTAIISCLNPIASGAGFFQRIGRRIEMKSIRLTASIRFRQAGTTPADDFARVMIIYDKQSNGAAPTIAAILQSQDNTTTSNSPFAGINLNNRDRFEVIRDQMVYLPLLTAANVSGPPDPVAPSYLMKMYAKLGGRITQFGADAGAIASITTGALLLVVYAGSAPADAQYELAGTTRLRFGDKQA